MDQKLVSRQQRSVHDDDDTASPVLRYLDAPNESALVRVYNDDDAAIDLLFFN